MLLGVIQIKEGAILVVAINDGPQVQTREYNIILAREIGISYIVVYFNKTDFRIGGEMKELIKFEILELLDI